MGETQARSRERLIAWATHQKNVSLDAAQAAALDSIYPRWRQSYGDAWLKKLEASAAFFSLNGRFPVSKSQNPSERALGTWISRQRQQRDLLKEEWVEQLDACLPGWSKNFHDVWDERLTRTAAFYSENKRLPSANSSDLAERRLGNWLVAVKHKRGAESAERIQSLDARLPVWRKTQDDFWHERLDSVAAFVVERGRFPVGKSTDADERKNGIWLQVYRANPHKLDAAKLALMDERIPGWNRTLEDVWNHNLEQCVSIHSAEGRFPSVAKNSSPEEKAAGFWLFAQRRRMIKLTPRRLETLDARLPGWR